MDQKINKASIAVVVLAMQRYKKLVNTIARLRSQTRALDEIIVVFQGDDKKIRNWLEAQDDLTLKIQENIGSAGGFSTGMQTAIANGHDWIWITDDDAFPEHDTLQKLVSTKYFDNEKTGLLSCVIVDVDKAVYMSPVPDDANKWYGTVLDEKCLPILSSAWPGCLVSAKAIQAYGLPIEEYFFYDEDIEFTSRIARNKPSYCVIDAVMHHHQEPTSNLWQSPERYKHFVRNKFATIRLSDESVAKKIARQFIWIFKLMLSVLTGKRPIGVLVPMIHGFLFFWPKIRYPEAAHLRK